MNRKNLTAAVLAGLAGAAGIVGTAQAVNINPDGLGQVLTYPYYTTNGGNTTILSVVNTTGDAKAVKVRFNEGENTREVLDFNLYMSAYDVWTAALYNDAGTPTLITKDTSCTVPYIYGNGGTQAFLPYAMNDKDPETFDDISRAAEGHFEVIEMGVLTNKSTYDNPNYDPEDPESPQSLSFGSADAATHGANGTPADCQQLVDAWTDPDDTESGDEGYWLADTLDNNPEVKNNVIVNGGSYIDIDPPSGGLFGGAAIVNVTAGTMYSYDATAINGFADGLPQEEYLHQVPGTVFPNLNSGNVDEATVFLSNGQTWDSGTMDRPVDAVSFVFMHDQIMNEYTTESGIGASTEWVLTFPTKHFYTYGPDIDGSAADEADAEAPFSSTWYWVPPVADNPDTTDVDESMPAYTHYPCEYAELDKLWDREEQTPVPDMPTGDPVPPIVSPAPPGTPPPDTGAVPFLLCYETSVIAFGQDPAEDATSILGSRNFHTIDNAGYDYGWARLNFLTAWYDGSGASDADGNVDADELAPRPTLQGLGGGLDGLPVTGFAVERFQNAFLGDGADVLANYGGIYKHKGTRSSVAVLID